MLICEVTAKKPRSPAQQRVAALKSQLNHARLVAQTQRLADCQVRLNKQRATLNKSLAQ